MPPAAGLFAGLAVSGFAAGLGLLALRPILPAGLSTGERLAMSAWAGLTLLSYAVLLTGVLGLLKLPIVLGLVAAVAAIGARPLVGLTRECVRSLRVWKPSRGEAALWAVTTLCAMFAATGVLNPPTTNEYDSLTYHLAAPKLYAEWGRIERIEYDHHTNSPFNLQMLYTIGLILGSEAMAKSFHLATYLLLIAAIAGVASRLSAERAGVVPALSAAVFATLPPVVWEAGTAYVDLGTSLGVLLAFVATAQWWNAPQSERLRWLAVCGVFCGTALATKILGGVALAFALLVVGYRALRDRRVHARGLAALVGLATLVCGPWYVRSWVYTGNPVYPYAYRLFGGADWDENCARSYRADQLTYGFGKVAEQARRGGYRPTSFSDRDAPSSPPGPIALVVNRLFAHGGPRPLVGLPLLPLFLTFDGPVFWESPMATGIIGPLLLAFLPALVICRPLAPWVVLALAFAVFGTVLWWFTTQLTRYLLPVLAVLALPCGLAAGALIGTRGHVATLARLVLGVGLGAQVACSLVMWIPQVGPAIGTVRREEAIRAGFDQWDLYQVANAELGTRDRIALYGEPRGYYLDVPYMWADYGHHTLFGYDSMTSPDDLVRAWHRHGVTAVLIGKRHAWPTYAGTDLVGRLMRPLVEDGRLVRMGETQRGILYRLADDSLPARSGQP